LKSPGLNAWNVEFHWNDSGDMLEMHGSTSFIASPPSLTFFILPVKIPQGDSEPYGQIYGVSEIPAMFTFHLVQGDI